MGVLLGLLLLLLLLMHRSDGHGAVYLAIEAALLLCGHSSHGWVIECRIEHVTSWWMGSLDRRRWLYKWVWWLYLFLKICMLHQLYSFFRVI
jgi:hypothetical protein